MSDKELYRVRLRQAESILTPFGKMVKGRDRFVAEGDKKLAYYRRNETTFDVRSVNAIPTARLPRSVIRRGRREVKTTYNGTIGENPIVEVIVDEEAAAPVVAVEPVEVEPEPVESDEPTVTTATTVFTESQLRRMKRAELVSIATEDFDIDVADKDLKREILERIIAASQKEE